MATIQPLVTGALADCPQSQLSDMTIKITKVIWQAIRDELAAAHAAGVAKVFSAEYAVADENDRMYY